MLHTDQDKWAQPQSAYGPSGGSGASSGLLAELAREIEDTQRRQGETLSHIVDRLRALDLTPGRKASHSQTASPAQSTAPPRTASDEPWDAASAEALMQSYENAGETPTGGWRQHVPSFGTQQEWIGDRFSDVTQRIKRALGDLKPGSTVALLEERLDQFQRYLASALEDVVRRSDLDGLRAIEGHVADLGQKLDVLEQHVSRLNGIEADVRSVMEQVSDERIARLLDYDTRFAADLEAVALRAAEEVHARLGQTSEQARADAHRHEELRALIEASIQDRRQAEQDAASLVSGLSSRVNAQADRYDDIKSLLEQAIQEQRQSEQTAFSMLDTLQQGLVSVLDRMDALEQQQAAPPAWTPPPQAPAPVAPAPAFAAAEPSTFGGCPAPPTMQPEPSPLEPSYSYGHAAPAAPEMPSPVEIPAAFDEPARPMEGGEEPGSTVDRIRREFIADARRAKMKAAANRAEIVGQSDETPKRGPIASLEATRAALTQAARLPTSGGSGRLFGASPKLLAVALAAVVLINGGLLLLSGKSETPEVPEISIEHTPSDAVPELPDATGSEPGAAPDARREPGPRSDAATDGSDVTGLAPASSAQDADGLTLTPYGLIDDVLNPPAVDANAPAAAPSGTTVAQSDADLPDALVADVYRQQVLATLSGKLGAAAAEQTPNGLLPEKSGRIDTAYTPTEIAPAVDEATAARASALDLPPATVGPLSLRLAAANGDASAEFEVAARLAEGKGTAQDYTEALRWYQRSASKGFAQSQYRLGTLYERGLGVTKDASRARVWYSRAAEQGNVKAMHNLAVLTAGGEQGEADYAAALPWFKKAAEHGLADSQYNLAVLVENGLGGKADRVAALKWYALAAQGGDADARSRRDALKAQLPAKDVKAAEAAVAAFKPVPAIALANDARAAGEDWKKRARAQSNG